MRVGIIQSNYIPWRGYFDIIDEVDIFIFYDDVQFTKNDWRNRNKIKTKTRLEWMTVPVRCERLAQRIDETRIDYARDWTRKHTRQLQQWYKSAPFFDRYNGEFQNILERRYETISQLNQALCLWLMKELHIKTKILNSRDLKPEGSKTERLLDILKKVSATNYLSGPAAKSYLDESLLANNGITLEYKTYDYAPYPQLWGAFEGNVTVLDLLFNTGPQAPEHLKSRVAPLEAISL